jgi:glucuronokinase
MFNTDFPNVIMDIERVELEIACGLQDRVVQTYGGLVHMDFTSPHNVYIEVDKELLPPMYLLYNTNTGG